MKSWSHPALLLLLTLSLAALPATADEALPHEAFVLDNGLRVILYEDHRLPLAAVTLWFHVGAADEPEGKSGFAHLFEHLMFMGTDRVPRGEYDRILEAAGGTSNASTGSDTTDYYAVGPSHLLPTMIWLEADRLEGLGNAMTQEKLDLQRDVVRNELRESYENESYGGADLRLNPEMYPSGHPYHNPVVGSHVDLAKATVEDVKQFFATFYVPNNATLCVVGDFEPKATHALIEKYFGAIERAAEAPRRAVPPVPPSRRRTVTLRDDVNYARTSLVWHTPPLYAPGDAELDLIADLLAEGKQGRLYKRLVHEERIAVDVAGWQGSEKLDSLFTIQATVSLGVDPARVEQAVMEELERLREKGPEEGELAGARARLETNFVSDLQEVLSIASSLQYYDAYFHQPDRLAWDLDRYRKATPEGVREAARTWLPADGPLVMRVLPQDAGRPPNPLDQRPPETVTRTFAPPTPEVSTLSNGLTVWHLNRPGAPLLSMRLLLPGGASDETFDTSGLSRLTSLMLEEGAGDLDTLAFAARLEQMGAVLWTWTDQEGAGVGLEMLARHADEATELLGLALRAPRHDADAWERIRTRRVLGLPRIGEDADALAARVAWQAYFESRHPGYALPTLGRVASMATLEVDDAKAFHRRHYDPRRSVLLTAGDATTEAVRGLLETHLGAWRGNEVLAPARAPVPVGDPSGKPSVVIVHRPEAEQTAVHFILPGVRWDDPDRRLLAVGCEVLGGSFTSRLNDRLREREGLTSGAFSFITALEAAGVIEASADVVTEKTGAALAAFRAEMDRILGGDVTDEEVERAVATMRSNIVQALEKADTTTGLYAPYARHGAGPDALARDYVELGKADAALVNAVLRRQLKDQPWVLVLVGDRDRILEQIEPLDLPATRVLTTEAALDRP